MNLESFKVNGAYLKLPWSFLELTGSDSFRFLQGQTTTDLKAISEGHADYSCLLDLAGKIETFFLLHKSENSFRLYMPDELLDSTLARLEKYLITEDVEMRKNSGPLHCYFGYKALAASQGIKDIARCTLWGLPAILSPHLQKIETKELDSKEWDFLAIHSGEGRLNYEVNLGRLLNETFLEERGVSYSKGCFLGQETVAKIHNFRGGAFFPVLLKSDVNLPAGTFTIEGRKAGEIKTSLDNYSYAYLLRDFRLNKAEYKIEIDSQSYKVVVNYYSFKKMNSTEQIQDILNLASHLFTHQNIIEEAKELLKIGIALDPKAQDLYESLGVIYGREEKYQEAIELMDQLAHLDPNSVMAYTNKSLYLMKLGKIEEAEAAKATATLKSFAYYGNEAKKKNEEEERKQKALQDRARRESMFRQVLEIDEEDALANYGLSEIYYEEGKFSDAVPLLEKVLKTDPKYSVAYLLKGKVYEALGYKEEAKATYRVGIPVAMGKGDMMPANEMQSRMVKL